MEVMNANYLALFILSAGISGCSTLTSPTARGPSSVSAGGLNQEEIAICDGTECKYLLAPCSMKEHSSLYRAPGSTSSPKYLSLKEESYLGEIENLSRRGFCQRPPRPMPAEHYNQDTCIYVFIKNETCLR